MLACIFGFEVISRWGTFVFVNVCECGFVLLIIEFLLCLPLLRLLFDVILHTRRGDVLYKSLDPAF